MIRDLTAADLDWLLSLNNAATPHVNHLERARLAGILDLACYARIALHEGRPAGALIALWPGADYVSNHYRWFSERFKNFLYIDRVMIDGTRRGGGLGRRLYADIERFARSNNASHIACEVNSQPPNPASMRFHEAVGFLPVGELANDDGSKSVVLMIKALDHGAEGNRP